MFTFAGAPVIETTHRQPRRTVPLTGITIAVVGMILNLAAFFAIYVLWSAGLDGAFKWRSGLIAARALIAELVATLF